MSARRAVPALAPAASTGSALDVLTDEGPAVVPVPAGRLDQAHAEALTERIRLTAGTVRDRMTRLAALVEQARAGEAWDVLGYASWTAYLADTLGGELHLPAPERRELVGMLAGEGMSTRAIAPIVGASPKTIARDVQTLDLPGVSPDTPAIAPIGLDGKRYANTHRGKRGFIGEHVIRQDEAGGWTCTCDFGCGSDYDANEHAHKKHGRYVYGGGAVDFGSAQFATSESVQHTIEGTEPERMVPTLPGLGVSKQPEWWPSYYAWLAGKFATDTPNKRAAFEAGWDAATARR